MTIKTNFFDGSGYSYGSADLVAPWNSLLSNGVFSITNGSLNVLSHSPSNLSVDVAAGSCILNGYYIKNDAVVNVAIAANTSGYNRIDSIVANVDMNNKVSSIIAVQGIPSSLPVAPALAANQLLLAQVLVGNNVSVLNQNVITDMRVDVDTNTPQNVNMFRQALINGNFDVWQRGTSFNFPANTSMNPYVADRWYITKVWGDVLNVSRQVFAIGQTEVPNNPRYFIRGTYINGAGKGINIEQKIEGLPFLGKTVTVSFWAKSNVVNSINILVSQYYSSSLQDQWLTQTTSTTTSWKKYSFTFTLPSGAGMSVDDNACTALILQAGFTNANDYIDIAQVQVNVGCSALPFIPKSYAQELNDCMRYYEIAAINSLVGNTQANGIILPLMYMFKVKKRTNPTVSFSSTGGINVDTTSPTAYSVTQDMVTCYKTNTNTINNWASWYSTMSVDAEL